MQNGINTINSDVSCSNKASDTIDAIFSFENLYKAYEDCTKGVKWKYSTQNFMKNASCRIARIRREILNGTYRNGLPRFFTVCERGKIRKINALPFKDRVVHKCLCDNYLVPLLRKSMIYDSGATLKNKGLSFTRKRIINHLQHSNTNEYVLKIDLHNYFEGIDHDILFAKFRKIMPEEIYNFITYLIPKNIKGLGLGSQISQISALYYLNDIDHFIKEKLRIHRYGRYMDDFYLIHSNKQKLKYCLIKIKEKLNEINIEINECKTKIYPLKYGFVFCKVRYILKNKILKFPASHSIRSFNHKLKLDILPSFRSYLLYFNKGLLYNLYTRRNSI